MKRLHFVLDHLKGFKLLMVLTIIVTIIYAGLNLTASLVFSYVIDNVIGGSAISNPLTHMVNTIVGGIDNVKSHFWILAILLIGIYILVAVFMSFRQRQQGVVAENLVETIRNDLYDHIQQLPYKFHVSTNTGELIQKCTSDVDMIRRFFSGQLCEIFYILSTAIIALIVLYMINAKLALFASISLPIIFVYSYLFFKKVQQQFLLSDQAEAIMTTKIQESLSGIRVVKAFNREKYEVDRFAQTNQDYVDVTYKMIKTLGGYWSSSYMICLLGILSVVVMGIFAVRNGELSIGNFVVFVTYQTSILYPIRMLGRIMSDYGKVTVSMDRLMDILDAPAEDLVHGSKPNMQGDIIFDHVKFNYGDDHFDVLKDISFQIHNGQTIAIIGPTGAGKSTLMYLLTRLYDPTGGTITINGVDITHINKKYLRENVGIVLQEPFLFSRTIESNLRIVNPTASEEEMVSATSIAAVHDVITSFERGYSTIVGEKGVTLSGGQKQRVAIARTLIKDTPILIFDDSLSAVDTETDEKIRHAIHSMEHKKTMIIITQRVSSAKDCDWIVVIEDGLITQQGTHDQLIVQDGLYQRINAIQSKVEEGDHHE